MRLNTSALARYLAILWSTTRIELQKRYAGTMIGPVWFLLYPALFLSMYLFLYLVVFKVRFPDLGEFSYVVFVFSGLVPYLALMECASFATSVIRQNIHLIKNVMVPIDIVPARVALTAMLVQIPGLAILTVLTLIDGSFSAKFLLLPVVLAVQFVFLLGLSYFLSALGGLFPDLSTGINIILIFLLFISPIAFPPDMVPESAALVVQLNPVSHLLGMFRGILLDHQTLSAMQIGGFALGSAVFLLLSRNFFNRFKAYIVDHE